MPKPNHFPREGEHNPVTAKRVRELQEYRVDLNHLREYTLGSDAQARIRAAADAERNYSMSRGARILEEASQHVRSEVDRVRKPEVLERAQREVTHTRVREALDMADIRRTAREHLRRQFQSQTESQSP